MRGGGVREGEIDYSSHYNGTIELRHKVGLDISVVETVRVA